MNSRLLTVSTSPHLLGRATIRSRHLETMLALLPAVGFGVYYFGGPGLMVILLSTAAAVAAEYLAQRLTKQEVTAGDLHAVLIGLLMGLVLPAGAPWWLPVVGGAFAVVVGKLFFGGLGGYPMNPVLVAWVALALSWPEQMNAFYQPLSSEWYVSETPLMMLKDDPSTLEVITRSQLWWGLVPGAVGATATWPLVIGGLYLVIRRIVPWQIPLGVLLGAAGMALLAAYTDPTLGELGYESFAQQWSIVTFHLGAGGLMIAAFFLAPEPVTSPVTPWGMFLFGLGVGFMTVIVRTWGAPVDGAFYGVLIMNAATPLLDRIRPKVLGKMEGTA